ncbi:MAG: hypothetical protein M0P49_06190 [Bacilli bacterium]|nr:hypothetical protein [Bacilli bacterium]
MREIEIAMNKEIRKLILSLAWIGVIAFSIWITKSPSCLLGFIGLAYIDFT